MRGLCQAGLFVAVAALCPPGCLPGEPTEDPAFVCGDDVCRNRLAVSMVDAEGQKWPDGAYELALDGGGRRYRVLCTVSEGLSRCEETDKASAALMDSARTFFLDIEAAPATAVLSVSRDETPVVDKTLRPNYATVTPNGPLCEPICLQAEITVEVEL